MTNEDKRLIEEAKYTTWEDCERLKSLADSEEAKREIESIGYHKWRITERIDYE